MIDHWKTCVWAVMLVVGICCVVGGLAWNDIAEVGECVLVRPLEAVSGSISNSGLVYHVDYTGTTKNTGEFCSTRKRVTMLEYDRVMYNRGTDERD